MVSQHKRVKLPDVVVRSRRRAQKGWFILGIALFGMLFIGISMRWSAMNSVWMMAAMLPFHVLVGLWLLWNERRLDIAATQADFALCLHCEYKLTRVKLIDECPKCGTDYNLEDVRACWQRWRPVWSGPKHKSSDAIDGNFKHVVLPRAVANDRRRIRIWYFLLMVTMFVSPEYLRRHPLPNVDSMFVSVTILALIVLVGIRFLHLERRLKKAALQADYALCLHCEYDLTGLDKQQHKCPECGTQYDLEYVRACWMSWRTMWEEAMG